MNPDDERYQRWIQQLRRDGAEAGLADRVMAAVGQADAARTASRLALLSMWIDRSRWRRVAACGGALLVGSTPFAYLAYVLQRIAF